MITFVQCVKGKPDLSITDFRRHWQEYEDRAKAIAEASGAVNLTCKTTLAVEQNLELRLTRGTAEPFDGVLEVRWPNAAGLEEALQDETAARLLEDFQAYQEVFIDFERSSFFFSSERLVYDRRSPTS